MPVDFRNRRCPHRSAMRARYKDRPKKSTNGVGMITPLHRVKNLLVCDYAHTDTLTDSPNTECLWHRSAATYASATPQLVVLSVQVRMWHRHLELHGDKMLHLFSDPYTHSIHPQFSTPVSATSLPIPTLSPWSLYPSPSHSNVENCPTNNPPYGVQILGIKFGIIQDNNSPWLRVRVSVSIMLGLANSWIWPKTLDSEKPACFPWVYTMMRYKWVPCS